MEHDKNSDFSDSDSSQDIDLEVQVNKNNKLLKVYQIQHDKDDNFKFTFMGFFENLPVVNLGDFNFENMYCNLTSHFISLDNINNLNNIDNNLFDIITLNININGKVTQLSVGIHFNNIIDIETLNTGSVYLRYVDKDKNINDIVKKNLMFPGSKNIIYFLVRELKNDKIQSYIK